MLRTIEYVNLYIEKYYNGKLILDFTTEREFIYFRNNGDYTENMRLYQYEPTMLYFDNVHNLHLSEGDIITIPMDVLINHRKHIDDLYFNNLKDSESPYNVFMSFTDGAWLVELFIQGVAFKNNRLRKKLVEHIEGTWQHGTPCTLNMISNNIDIEVVDVGQGSTNLIFSNDSLTIFDFGASIFASKFELGCISYKTSIAIENASKASLIISHWDGDHYNLLTVIDDKWLKKFCCVFFPAEIISLTSKQVVKRLLSVCKYIRTFKSPSPMNKGTMSMIPIITRQHYALYIGKNSNCINKSGLALAVKSSESTTVFGADHTNKQIWECLYPHIIDSNANKRLNIVVPHHGGNSGKINISSLDITPGIAAISVGKNTYKHPRQETIDIYENLKFNVKRTDWERKNIIIKMY